MNSDLINLEQLLKLAKHRSEKEAQALKSIRQQQQEAVQNLAFLKKDYKAFIETKKRQKEELMNSLISENALKPRQIKQYAAKTDELDQQQQAKAGKASKAESFVESLNTQVTQQRITYAQASARETKIRELRDQQSAIREQDLAYREDSEVEDTLAGMWSHKNI